MPEEKISIVEFKPVLGTQGLEKFTDLIQKYESLKPQTPYLYHHHSVQMAMDAWALLRNEVEEKYWPNIVTLGLVHDEGEWSEGNPREMAAEIFPDVFFWPGANTFLKATDYRVSWPKLPKIWKESSLAKATIAADLMQAISLRAYLNEKELARAKAALDADFRIKFGHPNSSENNIAFCKMATKSFIPMWPKISKMGDEVRFLFWKGFIKLLEEIHPGFDFSEVLTIPDLLRTLPQHYRS